MLGAQSFSHWTTREVPRVPFTLWSPWWGEDEKRKRCLWSCVLNQGHLQPAALCPGRDVSPPRRTGSAKLLPWGWGPGTAILAAAESELRGLPPVPPLPFVPYPALGAMGSRLPEGLGIRLPVIQDRRQRVLVLVMGRRDGEGPCP